MSISIATRMTDVITMEQVVKTITAKRKVLCTPEQRAKAFRRLHAFDGLEASYNRAIFNRVSSF